MSLQSYKQELDKRVELCKEAFAQTNEFERELHTRNLLEYLEGLDWFAEEEKRPKSETMPYGTSETYDLWKFCPIHGCALKISRGKATCQECK